MPNRYNFTLAIALCSAVVLYLLGTEDVSVPEPELTSTMVPAQESDAQQKEDLALVDKQADQEAADEESTKILQESAQVAFEPPFPDRINPFQAPKRQGRASVKAKGQNESAIELLGFVNVNGPQVALSIDGLVETASEGQKLQGIEVISIKPPAVLLQRGRQRWQATLEN